MWKIKEFQFSIYRNFANMVYMGKSKFAPTLLNEFIILKTNTL